MMNDRFTRTKLILGQDGIDKLQNSRVAVFGIGGVGGFAAEALARAGIGAIDLIDKDKVDVTNINRQIDSRGKHGGPGQGGGHEGADFGHRPGDTGDGS